jgi:hypothetical protein
MNEDSEIQIDQSVCDLHLLFQMDPLKLSDQGLERIIAEQRRQQLHIAQGGTPPRAGKPKLEGLSLKDIGLKRPK